MFKTLIRPAMIFIPFVLGVLLPKAHLLNGEPFNAVRWSLVVMVFLSSLQIRFSDLRPRREHWILLGVNVLMGLIPYFLLNNLLPGHQMLALAAFFVGITPTATAAPVVIAFLNGRIGFALTGFTISNVFISIFLLGLLPMVTGNLTLGFIGNVAVTLAEVIALPFALSLAVRKLYPRAREWPKHCKTFSFSLWSFTLFVIAAVARQHFIDHPNESLFEVLAIGGISLAICIANFSIGRALAPRRYSRESSQLLGQKNTTFSMYLALHYAGALVAMGPIFYVLWHNCWNAWQMYSYDRRRAIRKARSRGR
ncbi:MAG: bile acid:sodium symporter family protein [Victivallaceae bacterium]|nr:hypothetical protein [Victivallaceae bacterium]